MAYGTAQNAAQYIAAAFVGRKHAVGNHKGNAADMVGNNLQGYVGLFILAVFYAGNLSGVFNNREDKVGFKVGRLALQYGSKAFKACAGINVFIGKRGVSTVFMLVILGKYQVPDFKETIAVAAGFAVRPAAAAFFAHINVQLAVRSARAAAGFPEVFFKAYNAFIRHAYNIVPDFVCFVVSRMDGYPQFIGRQLQFFG